ncbi:MAG: hypothetical protein QXZ48_08875 [Zestosphaera sp.]
MMTTIARIKKAFSSPRIAGSNPSLNEVSYYHLIKLNTLTNKNLRIFLVSETLKVLV